LDGVRSRLHEPSIPAADIREALAFVGLAPTGRARDLGGRRSRNVAVPTAGGVKVVKMYRSDWEPRTVEVGHSVLERLEDRGVPAPRLVRAADGSGATQAVIDGAVFAVFDLLPGRAYDSTYLRRADRLGLMAMAGRTLAIWHEALVGFEPEGRHHLGFISLQGPPARGVEWYRETVAILRRDRVGSSRLVREGPVLVERIEGLAEVLETKDLPRVVIHGDFGLHNLLVHRGTAAPVDVELARIDHRLTDLLLVLDKHLGGGEPDVELLGALFDAYGAVSEVERAALGEAWRYRCLTSAVRSWWSAAGSADPAARVETAHRSLDRAGWVRANPEAAVRLFGEGVDG
jgi:Ser/Thr protein kinase RdoA (MazF antagonist)